VAEEYHTRCCERTSPRGYSLDEADSSSDEEGSLGSEISLGDADDLDERCHRLSHSQGLSPTSLC